MNTENRHALNIDSVTHWTIKRIDTSAEDVVSELLRSEHKNTGARIEHLENISDLSKKERMKKTKREE